jgi:signal transduction histidine kinase
MIKKILLLIFLLASYLGAYDSVKVLNNNITLHKAAWLSIAKNISAQEAKTLFLNNQFNSFEKQAKSLGYSPNVVWYGFEISIKESKETQYIDFKDITKEHADLYVFDGENLIKKESNGYIVPIDERKNKDFFINFQLQNSSKTLLYIFKTTSVHPHYNAFSLGTNKEIHKNWDERNTIFTIFFGIFLALILYNLFLYLIAKDKSYLFYCVYTTGLFLVNLLMYGYLNVIFPSLTPHTALFISIAMQIEIIGLVFFTEHFLQLKTDGIFMSKLNRYLLIINLVLSFAIPIAKGLQPIFILSLFVLFFSLLYTAFRSYKNGFRPAIFYLLATGVTLLSIILFMSMHQANLLPYNIWTFHLTNFGLGWDMVILSFALAYRIRILEEQKRDKARLLLIQSKNKSLGELTGNIAHQWRTPLGEVGSIFTNLQAKLSYSNISKEELQESINLGSDIIDHLSKTINTFEHFFQNSSKKQHFSISESIKKNIDFIKHSLQNIEITYTTEKEDTLYGNENEFSQVLINIILNAKDALIANNIQNPKISISSMSKNNLHTITIQDNAGGIKIKPIEKIFTPYETDKDDGSGIGLYIVKNLIKQSFHGTIEASNNSNGATFIIKLPKRT